MSITLKSYTYIERCGANTHKGGTKKEVADIAAWGEGEVGRRVKS
jgi:hypothetical protein